MADILFVRHAIALEREEWNQRGRSDFERPLTERGVRKFQQALAGLKTIVERVDVIYSSELVRAKDTANMMGKTYKLPIKCDPHFNHGQLPRKMLEHLKEKVAANPTQTIAIVGHEPELCIMLHLVCGIELEAAYLKKGGVAWVRGFPERTRLEWIKRPKELRALADLNSTNN